MAGTLTESTVAMREVLTPRGLSHEAARRYLEAPQFKKFGEWGETIRVAHRGTGWRLVKWLAANRVRGEHYRDAWERCQQANPAWFATYQTIRLCERSFFLPAGEVVFQVMKNPSQIPDKPPQGVLMRHWEALNAVPEATFYFLRPVFANEQTFGLCNPAELREEAQADRDDAIFAARLYGSGIRAAKWCKRRVTDLRDRIAVAVRKWEEAQLRRRIEARVRALNGRIRPRDVERLLAVTSRTHLPHDVAVFRRSLLDLRSRMAIDPILCFETPDRPGELWFEAHWYEGRDGRLYVAY